MLGEHSFWPYCSTAGLPWRLCRVSLSFSKASEDEDDDGDSNNDDDDEDEGASSSSDDEMTA